MVSAAWWTVHNPLFFHRFVEIERLLLQVAILVLNVPRGWASGFIVGGEGGEKKRGNLYFSCLFPNHPLLPK